MTPVTNQYSPGEGLIDQKTFLKKVSQMVETFPVVNKKTKRDNQSTDYYNVPAAFDIEVSSFYTYEDVDGVIVKRKCASMYIWQFGIWNLVTTGRTWEEYESFISKLSFILDLGPNKILVCYVHNLAYEFQFLRKRFEWEKVFFLDVRKPVYAVSNGVEYRCSYKLSGKSLAKVGEDLKRYKVKKMAGDLDYQLVRTSVSRLTPKELKYVENDIRVILCFIQEKIEDDGNILKIPLTNTGYVRRHCRERCFSHFKRYKALMRALTLTPDEYRQLKQAFAGGFTHANARWVKRVIEYMRSFDFTSSYPAVMVLKKFPMSKGKVISQLTIEQFKKFLETKCCLIDVTFYGVREKLTFEHYISVSKCWNIKSARDKEKLNVEEDNGRIVSADAVSLSITELDWDIITKFYTVESFEIHKLIIYEKGYLPRDFLLAILEMYKDKTRLKGVEGEEVLYMLSKNMLNSCYGMTVTDIVRDEIMFENGDDEEPYKKLKPSKDNEKMQAKIDEYNGSFNRFIYYPWGVWVTAWARHNLFTAILECGEDYVYADTDSVKIVNPDKHMEYFKRYNESVMEEIKKSSHDNQIDISMFSPKTNEGEVKPIGVWDDDGEYRFFKTLGAKRYMYLGWNDKHKEWKWTLTVAGLHKRRGMEYIRKLYREKRWRERAHNANKRGRERSISRLTIKDVFSEFNDTLFVPAEYSGRLTHTYCDTPCSGIIQDYNGVWGRYEELSYIHMEPSEYDLSISDEYSLFLDMLLGGDEIYD